MKMRRFFATLLVLAMVLVCVPVETDAVEQRENLLNIQMQQMENIINPEEGTYLFTTFEDLESIAISARNNPNTTYSAVLFTDDQLTLTRDLIIPENMILDSYNGKFMVDSGVKLTVEGVMNAKRLIVYGSIHVKKTGMVLIGGTLMLSEQYDDGVMTLEGALYLNNGLESIALDASQITYGETAVVVCNGTFENEEQLRNACKVAENADPHWSYYLQQTGFRVFLESDLIIPANCIVNGGGNVITTENDSELFLAGVLMTSLTLGCDFTILPSGGLAVEGNAYFLNKVTNLGVIEIAYGLEDYYGRFSMEYPELYCDSSPYGNGVIRVLSKAGNEFPAQAIPNFDVNDFSVEWAQSDGVSCWTLSNYQKFHEHTQVTEPALPATCLDYGYSESAYCATCGEVFYEKETLAPLGHSYTDPWDASCNVCGAERKVDKSHLTYSMYRMYDPFSGEHFYTGSMEERQMLEFNRWKYEGVGFTFPYSSGKPVYRLYDRNKTHEHLYTMDEEEKDALIAAGWEYEGIAFNSCPREEVPQYRLRNPNATRGAYHFTASIEEKDALIAAGWIYEGIGFYTCLQ